MEFLKSSRLLQVFSFSGSIVFQTIGPKVLSERSPLLTESTCGLSKVSPSLMPLSFSLWLSISFINEGHKFCLSFSIPLFLIPCSLISLRIQSFLLRPKFMPDINSTIFHYLKKTKVLQSENPGSKQKYQHLSFFIHK